MKEKIKQLIRYHRIKAWYEKYERLLIPGTLVFGVIIDFITFTTINVATAFILLGIYFLIAGGMIAYQNTSVFRYLRLSAPLVIQFTFGALLSGSFVFYVFSGTLFVSWPFIGVLVILMISNDMFRHYYLRPTVQISVYFFILFSLIAIILPFVAHAIGARVFMVSGALSLLLIAGYIALLTRIPHISFNLRRLEISIASIFICLNILYFLNVIPPIPLALRDSVIAHDIDRVRGGYALIVEEPSLLGRLLPGQTIHQKGPGSVYVYTAIFAPKDLATTIVHHWQRYDKVTREWVTQDRLGFQITGGAKTGYRGFSSKSRVVSGRWRVDVETRRGQVLGRVRFRVGSVDEAPKLKTVVK